MKSKPLFVLLLFLLWSAGSTYWYVCRIKGFCPPRQEQQATVPAPEPAPGPAQPAKVEKPFLTFDRNDAVPHINNDSLWQANIQKLLQQAEEGKRLKISGPYYAAETNTSTYDNLGLARAAGLKALLAKFTDTSKVMIAARKLTGTAGVPDFFDGFENTFALVTYNKFVHEEAGKTLIYFPFNSNKEIRNPQINAYLDRLAAQMKADPQMRIKITGHTDNIGKAETNLWTGMQRANRIRDILVRKGVDASRIQTASEGERKPIASNATREGRRKNRRVEIEIIR